MEEQQHLRTENEKITLENKSIEAEFDNEARLVSLKRKGGENILVRPANEASAPSWHL